MANIQLRSKQSPQGPPRQFAKNWAQSAAFFLTPMGVAVNSRVGDIVRKHFQHRKETFPMAMIIKLPNLGFGVALLLIQTRFHKDQQNELKTKGRRTNKGKSETVPETGRYHYN